MARKALSGLTTLSYLRTMLSCIKNTLWLCALLVSNTSASAQTYFLNGDATFLGDDCYRLTQALNYQNGTVWYGEQIDLTQPFDIQFRMNLGSFDGNGADGICFVLQTVGTAAIGETGGGMGYLNFGTSLGVEFDTWQNGDYNDPGFDHIAIHRDGNINHNSPLNIAGPVQMDPFDQNSEDGEDHVVQINWNPSEQSMQVYFDCNLRLQGSVDLINSVFSGQSLVYWGFTAATGGASNNQTVCLQENILNVGDEVTICPGASTILSAGSSLDGTYTWSPTDFLSDPASAAPTASPPSTTTYNVTFTDLCGNNVDADILVNVEELTVNIPSTATLTCSNPQLSVSASSNFANTSYVWTTLDGIILTDPTSNVFGTNEEGTYTLTATALEICTDTESITVVIDQIAPVPNAGADAVLNCLNPFLILNATAGTADALVQWNTQGTGLIVSGASTLTPTIGASGTYTLTVTDSGNGCVGSDALTITDDFAAPQITIALPDSLSCLQSQVELNVIQFEPLPSVTYEWSTEAGSIVNGASTASPTVNAAGVYSVIATNNSNGCSSNDSAEVVATDEVNIDLSSLTFPNIITPNNDDLNRTWKPFLRIDPELDLSLFFVEYELQIFNRWGALIFEGSPSQFDWKASDAESGVYYYIVRYRTECGGGVTGEREGYITVTR